MYKVLIAEDEELIRRGLIYTIDWLSLGCTVAGEAADGLEGLQKIKETRPDIVIADIRMPGMSGLEMIEKAKACVERFYAIILSSYSEFDYARQAILLDIAASLGVSVSYLSRKIKQETNMTFVDLLNGLRIAKAAELLNTGKYRMYEIAEMTGFTNYKYFCTVFKRYTGYAPSKLVR